MFNFFKKKNTLEQRVELLEESHNRICDLLQKLNDNIEQNKITNITLKQDVQILAQGLKEIYNLTEQIININIKR